PILKPLRQSVGGCAMALLFTFIICVIVGQSISLGLNGASDHTIWRAATMKIEPFAPSMARISRIILDECMSPRLVPLLSSPRHVPLLWSEGHEVRGTIIHVRNRRLNGASDHTIWRAAIDEDRTVCTINGKDFKKLAAATGLHPGVIDIPRGDTILNSLGS